MARKAPGEEAVPFQGLGGTVTVNGKAFAVGLMWEEAADKKRVLGQARSTARSHGADLVAARKADAGQYALGSTAAGHLVGMRSLAATVADGMEGNFVAAFEVQGGYYVVASRDGQILSGFDRFFRDKQEAQEAVGELSYGASWDTRIAPADFQIDDSNPTTIDVAIGGASTKARLQAVSQTGKYIRIAAAALICLGGVFGWQQYTFWQQQQAQEAEQQRVLQERAAEYEKERQKPRPQPLPYIGMAWGYDTVRGCVKRMLETSIEVAGWSADTLDCIEGRTGQDHHLTITLSLRRQTGTVNWALASLNAREPRPKVNWDGANGITAVWEFPVKVREYAPGSRSRPIDDVERYIRLQFEEFNQAVSLGRESYDPPPPNQQAGKTFFPPHRMLNIGIIAPQDPREFMAILAPIPVLTVSDMKLDIARMSWATTARAWEEVDVHPEGAGRTPPSSPRR